MMIARYARATAPSTRLLFSQSLVRSSVAFSTTANRSKTPDPIKKAGQKANDVASKAALKGVEATETVVESTKAAARKIHKDGKHVKENVKEDVKEEAKDLKEDAKDLKRDIRDVEKERDTATKK